MKAYAIYCKLNQCLALPFNALCQFDTENIFLSLVNFKWNSAIRLLLFYSKFNSHRSVYVFIYIKNNYINFSGWCNPAFLIFFHIFYLLLSNNDERNENYWFQHFWEHVRICCYLRLSVYMIVKKTEVNIVFWYH